MVLLVTPVLVACRTLFQICPLASELHLPAGQISLHSPQRRPTLCIFKTVVFSFLPPMPAFALQECGRTTSRSTGLSVHRSQKSRIRAFELVFCLVLFVLFFLFAVTLVFSRRSPVYNP